MYIIRIIGSNSSNALHVVSGTVTLTVTLTVFVPACQASAIVRHRITKKTPVGNTALFVSKSQAEHCARSIVYGGQRFDVEPANERFRLIGKPVPVTDKEWTVYHEGKRLIQSRNA